MKRLSLSTTRGGGVEVTIDVYISVAVEVRYLYSSQKCFYTRMSRPVSEKSGTTIK